MYSSDDRSPSRLGRPLRRVPSDGQVLRSGLQLEDFARVRLPEAGRSPVRHRTPVFQI